MVFSRSGKSVIFCDSVQKQLTEQPVVEPITFYVEALIKWTMPTTN